MSDPHATCAACGHENPGSARFCGECGALLAISVPCPDCGTENAPRQKFCNGCGRQLTPADPADRPAATLTASAAAAEGERKQVTVLFADVQGSMELAANVDSETWRTVMDGFFSLVGSCIDRYEGTVNKFTGDGAMALFGAPVAHEDHARRACYAALHLRDRLDAYAREVRRDHGLGFSVRMGLNSGEVVVGAVGDDRTMDYTAIGNTVGLAARMETVAEPGKPYLTALTAALVSSYFVLEPIGALRVKGVAEPVEAFALVGTSNVRSRLEASAAGGLSRFVGREDEFAALEAALARAASSGQVVGIVAEPGLGKSRLCHEFAERCRERGIEVTTGAGVAHGGRVPLLPVIEMLRRYFGIEEQHDARRVREKIAGRLLLLDEGFRDALPLLFDFLGVPDPERPLPPQMRPEARQRALFAVLRRLVHVGGRENERPAVLIVEDLHWLDPGSDAFLKNLVESLPGGRTLMIVNFRPEYRADWMRKSYYEQLPLVALDDGAVAALVKDLIGDDPSVDGLVELIAERTGGNPFFIEEVVQSLVERESLVGARGAYRLAGSIEQLEIPPTVQSLLEARIDRLPEREKSVLQSAAVIGREFSEPVLSKVTGLAPEVLAEAVASLADAELIYELTLYPEAQYAFKHPLTEEVAYRSQLDRRRARTHAAAAHALEEVYADRLDETAGVLASHWDRAHEPLTAARWAARAAAWAGESHPADALRHWRWVRTLLRDEHDSEEAAALALGACLWTLQYGWRLGVSDDEIDSTYREARSRAAARGNRWAQTAVLAAYGLARGMTGQLGEALSTTLEAQRLAREIGSVELEVSSGPAYWLSVAGRNDEALAQLELAMELVGDDYDVGRALIGFSVLVWCEMWRGIVLAELGHLTEGREAVERSLEVARAHEENENLGWAHSNMGIVSDYLGEPGDGLAHARAGVEVADRLGSAFSRQVGYEALALAHAAREEWAEALDAAETGLSMIRETRTGLQYQSVLLSVIARARLGRGELDHALAAAGEGAAIAERQGALPQEARCRWVAGRALALRDPHEAHAELERALALTRRASPVLEPHVHLALAELAEREGDEAGCRRALMRACDLFEEHGATGHLARSRKMLAALA